MPRNILVDLSPGPGPFNILLFFIGHWYYEKNWIYKNDLFLQVFIRSLQFPVRLVFPDLYVCVFVLLKLLTVVLTIIFSTVL